jgi:hypothetical protein
MTEIWKPVEGYNGNYEISTTGLLMSNKFKSPRLLKSPVSGAGYRHLVLSKNNVHKTVLIHRLVAQAFLPNPENKPEINHINGVKTDNRLENLEWCTKSENSCHSLRTGLTKQIGETANNAKLNERQIRVILHIKQIGKMPSTKVGKIFGVKPYTIREIWNKKRWKQVTI